jgi:competence protein ComEA
MTEGTGRWRSAWPVVLRWSDQACCLGLIVVALGWMGATWIYQGGLRGRLIDIDRSDPVAIEFQLDINRADWAEWSVLPGIGEQLARRIVQTRGARGEFVRHEDLLDVPGIGPRTLERVRPYLLPVDRVERDSTAVRNEQGPLLGRARVPILRGEGK